MPVETDLERRNRALVAFTLLRLGLRRLATTDMTEAGIIDPTKVVRLALEGVASIASLLIITEVMVAEKSDGTKRCSFASIAYAFEFVKLFGCSPPARAAVRWPRTDRL